MSSGQYAQEQFDNYIFFTNWAGIVVVYAFLSKNLVSTPCETLWSIINAIELPDLKIFTISLVPAIPFLIWFLQIYFFLDIPLTDLKIYYLMVCKLLPNLYQIFQSALLIIQKLSKWPEINITGFFSSFIFSI